MFKEEFFLHLGDLVRVNNGMWLVVGVKKNKEVSYFDITWWRCGGPGWVNKNAIISTSLVHVQPKNAYWICEIIRKKEIK